MPRCLSEGVDIFLKSAEKQGESGHDVRVSQAMRAWLLAHMDGACRRPRHDENRYITFRRKFTPGDATSRRDVPFAAGVRGVTAALRYEPCTQFINVSQRTLHIYWQFSAMSHAIHKIVSKRRCQSYFISRRSPHHGISKDSDLCASAHRCLHYAYARLIARVTLNLLPVLILQSRLHESLEQRMGSVGSGLELGVSLGGYEEGMLGELAHFHDTSVRG